MSNPENFSIRPNVRARIYLTLNSQNIPNNTSSVRVRLVCEETAQQPTYHLDDNLPWSVNPNTGSPFSGDWYFDFRPSGNQSYELLDSNRTVTHNADGTFTYSVTSSVDGDLLGSSSPNASLVLPRIPRGPRVKDAGIYKNTILYVKDAGIYKIAIPYVKDAGTYKIGGS